MSDEETLMVRSSLLFYQTEDGKQRKGYKSSDE
jgi:hypothetical protein